VFGYVWLTLVIRHLHFTGAKAVQSRASRTASSFLGETLGAAGVQLQPTENFTAKNFTKTTAETLNKHCNLIQNLPNAFSIYHSTIYQSVPAIASATLEPCGLFPLTLKTLGWQEKELSLRREGDVAELGILLEGRRLTMADARGLFWNP
jgi:hypothetical protein